MKKLLIAAAALVSLASAAQADSAIYVYQITGIEVCKVANPEAKKLVYMSQQQLGERMMAGEFTSADLAKWKADYAAQAKGAAFCSKFASYLKILDIPAK